MGQIIGSAAKPKRCNKNRLSQLGTPAAGEYILVSSDNSMNAAGQGNFDCYIEGDGTKAATALELHYFDEPIIEDEEVIARALINHDERIEELEKSGSIGEEEEFVIAEALNELNGKIEGCVDITGYVSPDNSDIIAILGASFADGSTPAQGKDWTSILSALTDYNYKDYAVSGSNIYGWLNNIVRNNQLKGSKYGLITMWINNGITYQDFPKIGTYIVDSLESIGVMPIIGSCYTDGASDLAYLQNLAKERNYYYFPCGEYFGLTKAGRSHVGDNGFHLGTRDIGVWSNGYLIQAPYIDAPMQSFKIFRLRSGSYTKTLDELVFHSNEERLENFRELYFGQLRGGDEYAAMNNGVSFTNAALLSVILPIETPYLTSVKLLFNSDSNVKVYALNSNASPYPQLTYYSRFSVEDIVVTIPKAGARYSDGTNTFTVATVVEGENGMSFTMYCTPAINSTAGSGTLTKIGGDGETTINYSMREYTSLSLSNALAADNGGHWIELSNDNGGYVLNNIAGCVHIDKVNFLVVYDGDFTLSNAKVTYSGDKIKTPKAGHIVTFDSNEFSSSEELIQEPTFGAIGNVLTSWVDANGNGVITEGSYDGYYPFDSSVVMLSDVKTMAQTISLPVGRYYLEIFAKYLTATVDEESYDFNPLNINIYTETDSVTSERNFKIVKMVGLSFTICRVPITISSPKNITITLSSNNLGLEVGKVSLKKY